MSTTYLNKMYLGKLFLLVLTLKAAEVNCLIEPVVLVHGGAGEVPTSRIPGKLNGVKLAAKMGYEALMNTGSIVDAVEAAVISLEKDEYFNAGYGSVLTTDGEVEMEASIQRGSDLQAGCVTLVKDFPHPISIAKRLLERGEHTFLGGEGGRRMALAAGFTPVEPQSLITNYSREALQNFLQSGSITAVSGEQLKFGDLGTVGAVGVDDAGRVAAATSTGGLTGKPPGRIGDTPLLGSGTYATDDVAAVSSTGHGESIMKYNLAHSIIMLMSSGRSAQSATKEAVDSMTNKLNNTAGAITLSKHGDVGVYTSSGQMSWAYVKGGKLHYGIMEGDHYVEDIQEISHQG